MALANALDNVLPDWARTALDRIGVQWNEAKGNPAKQNELHNAAEAIRGQFGYSGGIDGSKIINLAKGVVNTVTQFVTPGGGNTVAPVSAPTVANTVDVLDPTSSTGLPTLPDSAALTLPSINIPQSTKSIMLYGVLALGGLMLLKMFTGGKKG